MAQDTMLRLARVRPRERLRRHFHRVERHRQLVRAGVVGLVSGLLAVAFQVAVGGAETAALLMRDRVAQAGYAAWALLICSTAALGASAAWLTGRFAPEAGGSGIPHIKAALIHLRALRP